MYTEKMNSVETEKLLTGENEENLLLEGWTISEDGVLAGDRTIRKIEKEKFCGKGYIKGVNLSNCTNLIEIDDYAFMSCKALEFVDFGEQSNIRRIGKYAFAQNESLKEINLSNLMKIRNIEKGCFAGSGLQIFTAPEDVAIIGRDLFGECEDLKQVNIPQRIFNKMSNGNSWNKEVLEFVFGKMKAQKNIKILYGDTQVDENAVAGGKDGKQTECEIRIEKRKIINFHQIESDTPDGSNSMKKYTAAGMYGKSKRKPNQK